MQSEIMVKGKKLKIITQQYTIGLYAAVYDNETCIHQFCVDVEEQEFHRNLGKYIKIDKPKRRSKSD